MTDMLWNLFLANYKGSITVILPMRNDSTWVELLNTRVNQWEHETDGFHPTTYLLRLYREGVDNQRTEGLDPMDIYCTHEDYPNIVVSQHGFIPRRSEMLRLIQRDMQTFGQ
jgi:hypothetical protein